MILFEDLQFLLQIFSFFILFISDTPSSQQHFHSKQNHSDVCAAPSMQLTFLTSLPLRNSLSYTCAGRKQISSRRRKRQTTFYFHDAYTVRMSAASVTSGATGERLADEQILVNAASATYPILFQDGGIDDSSFYTKYVRGDKALIITNDIVGPLYLKRVRKGLEKAGKIVFEVVLPDGEEHKSIKSLSAIWDACMRARLDRKSSIIALGGGVVGDVAGFAAATFVRGVPFMQIPTTLLAVVDSAVGGKTAINHPGGKNMIGAFYQPQVVLVDSTVLSTLNEREIAAGISEVIKYGVIRDWTFFEWCETNVEKLMDRDSTALRYAMRKSCEYKAQVVAEDEKESGIRAILNLGHTFGHAIEASMGYGNWLHGEAVAAGMVMACKMSEKMGLIDGEVTKRLEKVLVKASLPVRPPPSVTLELFMTYMSVDKKVESGKLRLVLLRAPGDAFVTSDFDQELLFDTIMLYHQMYKESPGTYEHSMFGLPL